MKTPLQPLENPAQYRFKEPLTLESYHPWLRVWGVLKASIVGASSTVPANKELYKSIRKSIACLLACLIRTVVQASRATKGCLPAKKTKIRKDAHDSASQAVQHTPPTNRLLESLGFRGLIGFRVQRH